MVTKRKIFLRAEIMKKTKQISGFFLALVGLLLQACSPQVYNTVPLGSPGTIAPPMQEEYKINAGDHLSIKLFYNPELNQAVVVRPDGRISLQLVNEVKVVGLTPAKLSEILTEGYSKYLAQSPEISVIVESFAQKIFVGGEVAGPGAIGGGTGAGIRDLTGPTTVLGAITLAGGFKDTADRNRVILIRKDENSRPFYMCLDIEKAMKGIDPNQDIYVQASDMILVPRSDIANVDLWVQQYIGGLISPFTGLGYIFIPSGGVVK
jgi:protein involved in polysaccharide export with SLBB domain